LSDFIEKNSEIELPENLRKELANIDYGTITSAYGPVEAGDLRDIVGQPPELEDADE